MSGHTKWSKIKRKKGVADAKRSANYTKLANIISVAARNGGDPDTNFQLRMAIDKAKSFSLPKDNIERAIKRGTGELEGQQIEEMIYEGYGPDGIAIVIDVVTDNKNRASANIKHILSKYGGNLGAPNSVMWQFQQKGVITLDKNELSDEEQLELIDSGADDIKTDEGITIYTSVNQFENVKKKIESISLPTLEAGLEYVAKDTVKPQKEESLLKLFEALDDCDDVNNFYSNADL